jgi:membrane-associated phospholipid phosphatase
VTSNPKAGVLLVAIVYYASFLFLWTLSHELSDMRAVRYPLYFAWESEIVFRGWALPLYFSLDIAPVGTLFAQTAVAAIFFVLVPIDPGYETMGVWGPYFYEYFGLENISRWNHAPSLHVSYVFTMAWIIGMRYGKVSMTISLIWACVVSVSTMLVHEHHFICVLSGFALFLFTMVSVYPALQRKYNNDSTHRTLPDSTA